MDSPKYFILSSLIFPNKLFDKFNLKYYNSGKYLKPSLKYFKLFFTYSKLF